MINNDNLLDFVNENKEKILELIVKCGSHVKNGVSVDEVKVPFNFLDYYSIIHDTELAGLDHRVVIDMANRLRQKRSFQGPSRFYVNRFADYANINFYLGPVVNSPQEILDCRYAFEINGVRFEPTYEDVQNVMNVFYYLEIPTYHKLIYQALNRIARNIPVFPLLVEEDEKKAGK